jgi:hypothetical protein
MGNRVGPHPKLRQRQFSFPAERRAWHKKLRRLFPNAAELQVAAAVTSALAPKSNVNFRDAPLRRALLAETTSGHRGASLGRANWECDGLYDGVALGLMSMITQAGHWRRNQLEPYVIEDGWKGNALRDGIDADNVKTLLAQPGPDLVRIGKEMLRALDL